MNAPRRLLESRHDARGAVIVVMLVALLRLLLERGLSSHVAPAGSLPPLGVMMPVGNAVFYALCFWLFSALLAPLLGRSHRQVGNAVLVGLVMGVLPPLIELYLPGAEPHPFIWYREVSWTFFAPDQPRSEGITLWLLVVATGGWVWYFTRSVARAGLGLIGAYLMWPAITAVVNAFGPTGLSALGLLAVAFALWFGLRAKVLMRCLSRLNHGLPHGALALVGALWLGRAPEVGLERAAVIVLGVFVMLVHNDHYDRKEDEAAGRPASSDADDVVWATFFYALLLLSLWQREPLLSVIGFCFLLFGFVYHHPALRLKERFCLSYLVEGSWAALAFAAGAAAGSELAPGPDLLVPGTAIFGGGALVSAAKDWKDVAADRVARIPTIYVLMTGRGHDERAVHRAVVAAITLGVLVPPLWLALATDAHAGPVLALAVAALAPGALLMAVTRRGRAVELTMWALTGYLLLLGLAVASRPTTLAPAPTPLAPPAVATYAPPAAPAAPMTAAPGDALRALFEPFRPEAMTSAPIDFGRLRHGTAAGPSYAVTPDSVGELAQIVATAYAHDVPLRIRGRGHSMNGSTLPGTGELTVRTAGLDGARFEKPGTVTVEAGVGLQDLRKALAPLGYDLPVYNGGTSDGGPSVGGFINAGGFGGGSAEFGGFWDNVDAVTLVVADGQSKTLDRGDPDFGWLFGAMGQLGIVREARLDLVAVDRAHAPSYPAGKAFVVTRPSPRSDATAAPPMYWYTLFVSADEKDAATRALADIQARHAGDLVYREPYSYPIRHRAVTAPLVYGRAGDFFAIGIWGDTPRDPSVVDAIDAEVAALARAAGYRRYLQAEVLGGPDAYRDYYGADTYAEFQRRRRANDPKGLFNRGSVFRD